MLAQRVAWAMLPHVFYVDGNRFLQAIALVAVLSAVTGRDRGAIQKSYTTQLASIPPEGALAEQLVVYFLDRCDPVSYKLTETALTAALDRAEARAGASCSATGSTAPAVVASASTALVPVPQGRPEEPHVS